MTADIELLPLPIHTEAGEFTFDAHVFEHMDMVSYARANVAHAAAAKDAEIEALRDDVDTATRMHAITREHLEAAEARANRLSEEIDWIKSQPEGDRMFAEIEAAAKASFHRHRTSCRGQVLTRADNYESHLVWATLEWAKRTNGAEQHAEQLAEALRDIESVTRDSGGYVHDVARAALRDHDQEVGNG